MESGDEVVFVCEVIRNTRPFPSTLPFVVPSQNGVVPPVPPPIRYVAPPLAFLEPEPAPPAELPLLEPFQMPTSNFVLAPDFMPGGEGRQIGYFPAPVDKDFYIEIFYLMNDDPLYLNLGLLEYQYAKPRVSKGMWNKFKKEPKLN
jgi:hypothetical protein